MTLPPRSDSESQDRDNQHDEQPHDVNDGQEYPELDEFVGEFRDGERFTDVDSRVWV